MESLGEETDNVVESVSKLQSKVKALTGVDILTETGDYKATYDIIKEIATVWKDMSDIDQAALLEMLAGKNRSNAMAAMLTNIEDLKGAYQDAMDAEGSAMAENEKQLNSIQGKITLFKNATQTMWVDTINSDVVKTLVDIGTEFVKIIDKVGLLNTAFGTFAGWKVFMNDMKNMKAEMDKLVFKQTISEDGNVYFEQVKASAKSMAETVREANQEVQDSTNQAAQARTTATQEHVAASQAVVEATQAEAAVTEANTAATQGEIVTDQISTEVKTENAMAGIASEAATQGETSATLEHTTATIADTIATKAATVATKALAIAKSALKAGLIGLAVGLITAGIQKLVEVFASAAQKADKLKQEISEMTREYNNAKKSFSENLTKLTESSDVTLYKTLQDEFEELAKGVDKYGNNIGLTADEYSRYRDICEKIVGIQPSIVAGYDSATEAIGNNVSILQRLIELQEEEARTKTAEYLSNENMNKIAKNAVEGYKMATNVPTDIAYSGVKIKDNGEKDYGYVNQIPEYIARVIGVEKDTWESTQDYVTRNYSLIKDNISKILKVARENFIDDDGVEWEALSDNQIKSLEQYLKGLLDASDGVIDALLQAPSLVKGYNKLNSSNISFITEWIKNSDMFKIDEDTSEEEVQQMRDTIEGFVQKLVNGDYTTTLSDGTEINATDIIDKIMNFDDSTVDYATYQLKIQELIDNLWNSLDSEGQKAFNNNKNNLAKSIGFDFTIKNNDIAKQADAIAERIKTDSKVIQYKLQQMTPAEVDAFLKIEWNTTDINSWDDVVAKIQKQAQSFDAFSVDMFSTISDDISKFNEVLSQTEEIVADNTTVTKEYKESLTALGFSQEDLNDVFDESNPLLVKNAALLRKLVTQKKEEKRATVQMAKANNLLQYRNTVKQLQQVVKAMATERNSATGVTKATLKTVDALRSQLTTLKQTQREYALLEIQLSGATNAYENFEKAKSMDEKLTYGDSMIEMLNTLNDGFKTGQVGIEAFQAAVATLVPSSVYEDLDNFNDRMVAIHDYIDQNPLFADWFTIKDGEFSITQKNIQNFVDDAQKAGAFTGSDENGNFDLGEGVETIDDFVNKINEAQDGVGVTKEAVVAMITEFSKYDATWSDVLYDLTTNKFDKEVNKTTAELEKAVSAQDEYIRSGKSLDGEEWKTICKNVEAAEAALNKANAAAQHNTDQYTKLQTLYNMAQGKIKGTKGEADALAKSLGLVDKNGKGITFELDENGKLKLTTEQAEILNQKLGKLKEPTIVSVQFDFDTLSKQLEVAKKYIKGDELSEEDKTVLFNAGINVDKITPEQLQAKINSLPEDQKQVLLDAGINFDGLSKEEIQQKIDEMSDDQKKVLLDAGIKVDALTADELTTACNNLISTVEPTLKSISLTYGITQTSEEQQDGTIEKLKNWEVSGIHFTAYAEVDGDGKKKVEELNEEKDKLSEPETTTYTVDGTGEQAVYGIKDAWAAIPTTKTTTYTVKQEGSIPGGGDSLNGTAHASGDWGVKQDETGSLVGELGPETLVRNGKWKTIGDNGAEMVNLKKGDIIFNHKQTEQLLKNGHINSRGKMVGGQSFAEGNAHYGLFTGYTDYEEVFKNGSNDWVEAWDDTLRSISDAADSINGAGDDLSDAADDFEEMFDWFAVLLEEIDDDLNYVSAKLENAVGISAKNSLQDEMININKLKLTELGEGYKLYADYAAQLLEKVPEQYRNLAEQGGVALTEFLGEANQEVVEAINNYREWAQKASDVRTQQQQVKKEITSLSLQKVQTIADEYDRVITKITTLNDLLQANVDLIDEQGERTSAVMYEEMIKNSIKELDELQKKRNDMQKEFDAQVSAGNIDVGSEEWYEGVAAIQDVDKAIIDCRKEIEGFQNSINQLHWDNFDGLIKAIDNVGNEISNLGDLIDDEDIADEMGNWTNEGITKMGLLAQEMERAQYRAKQYAEQIEYLNQEYAAGKYSTDEYNEKLQELKDGQWDSIKSYEAAKDALIALNKTRVDAAKNAMQEEIDAYNELINKKKEELQLSKDAHDFSKQVEEQQKNIANIQKQLAAIAGDNSASAIARRKKLEAELAAAQEELDELYYSHSIEKQQDALDDQAENYQDEKEKEMEALDEYLKNVEQVIADSFATITGNTEAVAGTLKEIADEYGINLSEAITNPWEQGVIAIGTYQDQLNTSTSAFTAQLEAIKKQLLDLQAAADETARHLIDATNQNANKTSSATYTAPTPSTPQQPSTPQKPAAPANGSSVTVKKSATHFTRDGGNGTRMQSWVPGSTFTVYQVSGSEVLIGRNGQYTGWIKLSDIEGYAKGIKKVPNDQFAITDELGLEELVLHADTNGRLQYLSKGSSVIPSDITDNLMKLGTLDPKDILDRNKPKIGAPYIINNSIELNMSFGNMINIEHADRDSIPDIKDAVKAQLDSYMKGVNNSLKRFTR